MYCLPVIPGQLVRAGYDENHVFVMTAASCGIGSIISGIFSNLPFVVAPLTSITIFLAVAVRQHEMPLREANQAVVASGFFLIALGYRPFMKFFAQLIPSCIQTATSIGVGLLTCLAGCREIEFIVTGQYTLVEMASPLTAGNLLSRVKRM